MKLEVSDSHSLSGMVALSFLSALELGMDDPLRSPRLMLSEIDANILEIDQTIKVFLAKCRAIRFTEREEATGNKLFKAKLTSDWPIPDRCALLASRAVSDLRHALDQVYYNCIRVSAGIEDPGSIYFPICNSPKDLEGRLRADKVPMFVHEPFKAARPYPTIQGVVDGNDVLCQISKAAQRKHRMVCSLDGQITGYAISGTMYGVILFHDPVWDYSKHEIWLCTTTPEGEFNCNITITPQITFKEAGALDGMPIVPFLRAARSEVAKIIDEIGKLI